MTLELWLAFAVYAVVTSVTPGPNNMMLFATGVNHGLRRALPHLFGVNVGFAVLLASTGLGLGALFRAVPVLHTVLQVVGAAYLLWLAWAVARSGPVEGGADARPPITFAEAAAFQWVNPKGWVMALGAVAAYVPEAGYLRNLAIVVVSFAILGLPCGVAWIVAGAGLRRVLADPRTVRLVNGALAASLVASLAATLWAVRAG
jgi:threonine/homoserine/homoserine lactone efflux protein